MQASSLKQYFIRKINAMKDEMKKTNQNETPIVSESALGYHQTPLQKKLVVFASHNDQQKHEDELIRNQPPLERLRDAVALIKQVYMLELANYMPSKRITILEP